MWTAALFQVTSGNIGPRLNPESFSWTIALNGTESISMKLKKSDLPAVDLTKWLSPWWAGVVLYWDNVPVVAGPIIARPTEDINSVALNCGGIRSVLTRRLVAYEYSDWSQLSKSVVSYSGLSLGTIAQRVVALSQQKVGGTLPISFPMPEENAILNDADHQRNYRGFNLQNINCDDILTKLSEVINGPDIMFKPRLIRDNLLTFDMWHGTERQPRISQTQTPVWDLTPVNGQVADMSTIVTGTYQTSRVYSLGAGQDEGLLIKVATDDTPIQAGYPLLETVINIGSSEDPNVVLNYANANIKTNIAPLLEVQMTVRGDGDIPFGKFWPGDLIDVVTKGWISIPDGMTPMRLLSISGDSTSEVKASLQREDKFV